MLPSCRAKGLLKKLMHFNKNPATTHDVGAVSSLNTSGSADPSPPSPPLAKAEASGSASKRAARQRNAHLPHVTARYPFKDNLSSMRQVLFQDALDCVPGEKLLSCSAAAQQDMQTALKAMTEQQAKTKHDQEAASARSASHKAPLKAEAAAQLAATPPPAATSPPPNRSRFQGNALPRPTKLCYGGERPRTAASGVRSKPGRGGSKPVKGGSPSRLPIRRSKPRVASTRANATSSRTPSGLALAQEVHPNRAGRSSMKHNRTTAGSANKALLKHATAKYTQGWRKGGGSAASSVSNTSAARSESAPLSPDSTGTERSALSPRCDPPSAPPATPPAEASALASAEAAVAAMYASLSREAAAQAKRNAAASGRSQLEEEAAERRRAEAEQKAFRAATQGDDEAAAVFLGLKKAPGMGSSRGSAARLQRQKGGGATGSQAQVRGASHQHQNLQPLAVDAAEAAAAQELMQLTARMGRATLAAEDVAQLASPAARRAPLDPPADAPGARQATTPAKARPVGPLAMSGNAATSDVHELMSPDPRYRGERGVELSAREAMPELPPRDPSKPPTYLDTQLLPGGRGPRYLQSVKSRIAPLVRHFKATHPQQSKQPPAARHAPPQSAQSSKLPPSQAAALLYAVATGQDAIPQSTEEQRAPADASAKLSFGGQSHKGPLPVVNADTAAFSGLPGASAGYTASHGELQATRSREAQARQEAARALAEQRATQLAAQGVRMSRAAVGWEVPTGAGVAPPEVPLPPSAASTLHKLRKAELRRAAAAAGGGASRTWPQAQLMTRSGAAVLLGQEEGTDASAGGGDTAAARLPAWYTDMVQGLQQVGIMLQTSALATSDSWSASGSDGSSALETAHALSVPHTAVHAAPTSAQRASSSDDTGSAPADAYDVQFDQRGVVTGSSALATARAFLKGPVHAALRGSAGPLQDGLPKIPAGAVSMRSSDSVQSDGGSASHSASAAGEREGAGAAASDGGSSQEDWEAALQLPQQRNTEDTVNVRELFDLEGLQESVEAVRDIAFRGNEAVTELDLSSGSSSSSHFSAAESS